MNKAFTMIELIFVIVIIGILAAVAIPKLSATRDDAAIATIISNARVALGDFEGYYTSQGNTVWNNQVISDVTNALLSTSCNTPIEANTSISPNTFVLCHDDVICLSFETTVEGYLTIIDGTVTTDRICEEVKADPAIKNMSNKTYVLGGKTISRQ
jgi:prepilin-type N-terminal cleavage/methylation domain-containing protein